MDEADAAMLGVIGGMGPLATAAFLRTLTLEAAATRDQDHLHVVVDSDPSIPDRTDFLIGAGPDPRPALIRSARRLEAAGATFLAMPCNTANLFAAEISAATSIPLLSWIEIAAARAAQSGGVGIMATDGTLSTGAYQAAVEQHGVKAVIPNPADQRVVMGAIYSERGVKATGTLGPEERVQLLNVANRLADDGADCVLLGCTELPLAIPADDSGWPLRIIDPAIEVAREAIRFAGLPLRARGGPTRPKNGEAHGGGVA